MRYFTALLVITGLLGLGYFSYIQSSDTAAGQSTLVATDTTGSTGQAGQQVLLLLKRLQAIKLDGATLFNDPAFKSLQDWTVTISPQPVGRSNPFLPAFSAPSSNGQSFVTPNF